MAGAVRQAAWQFRLKPPRVNGRPTIGVWVRFRVNYIVEKERPDQPKPQPDDGP